MSYSNNNTMFTTDDRAALTALGVHLARSLVRPVTVETCAEDGPEWAALVPVERRRGSRGALPTVDRRQTVSEAHDGPVMSMQVTTEPGRRLVLLAADGRTELAACDELGAVGDLAAMVLALTH